MTDKKPKTEGFTQADWKAYHVGFEQGKLAVLEMLEKNVKDFKKSRNKHKKTQGDKYPYWRGMENGQVGLVERLKSQLK